jgi:hypothetical protein
MALITPPIRAGEEGSSRHHFWGRVTDAASLPNVTGSPNFSPPIGGLNVLEPGDVCYVDADECLYVCIFEGTPPFLGADTAIWRCMVQSGGNQPGHGSILTWGNDRLVASAGRRFLYPGYDDQVAEVQPVWVPAPAAGVIRDLTVFFNEPYTPPPGVKGTLDFTLCAFTGAGQPPDYGSAAWPTPNTGPDTALEILGVTADLTGRVQNTVDTVAVPAKALLCVAVDKNEDPPPAPPGLDVPEGVLTTFRWT